MRYRLLLFQLWIVCFSSEKLCAQSGIDDVFFVNTGKMYVAPTAREDTTTFYLQGSMQTLSDTSEVWLHGVMKIDGDFWHDAKTHAFAIDPATGITICNGSFIFCGERGVQHKVAASNNLLSSFNRATCYIAFPHFFIDTNDTIFLPARMGMDARTISAASNKSGKLLLSSEEDGEGDDRRIIEASLRFPEATKISSEQVQPGLVLVEREMKLYRTSEQLFGFATPFDGTQLTGYFAGNWLRRPQAGANMHTTYVLGNKPSTSNPNTIHADQYVSDALEKLKVGQAYFVKPRPQDFSYGDLHASGGLQTTGAEPSLYDVDKFLFDGHVYELPVYDEQLFARDTLWSYTFPEETTISNTLNWVIGNSYTSAISLTRLAGKMVNSPLTFSNTLYVFPQGATAYQPVTISESGDAIIVSNIDEVPSMSIFMLRVSKNQQGAIPAGTKFAITKDVLVHGTLPSTPPDNSESIHKAPRNGNNQVRFHVSSLETPAVYDLAAIGLRATALPGNDSYDLSKVYSSEKEGFCLYTLSSAGAKLSANGLPLDAVKVNMGFKPASTGAAFAIRAEIAGNLSSEALWLEDTKTNVFVNLYENPQYIFESQPSDNEERFTVHFRTPDHFTITGRPDASELSIHCFNNRLIIGNLTAADHGSHIRISDTSGRLVHHSTVDNYPVMEFPVDLNKSIYIVRVQGNRSAQAKIMSK